MTKKEIKKYNVIQACLDGLYTVPQAAKELNLSERQVQRLKKEVSENGVNGVIHKSRGKKPNNALSDELEYKIVELKKSYNYELANFFHFIELLKEQENIDVFLILIPTKF